ncbi:MAG: hypothetical protein Q7U14_03585 [Lacisediminimonas sp.]|nr:hypothetical protein [Lacisediminimonas sp.]
MIKAEGGSPAFRFFSGTRIADLNIVVKYQDGRWVGLPVLRIHKIALLGTSQARIDEIAIVFLHGEINKWTNCQKATQAGSRGEPY